MTEQQTSVAYLKNILPKEEGLNLISYLVEEAFESLSAGDAYRLVNGLSAALKLVNLPPQIRSVYDHHVLVLKYTCFHMLEPEEQKELLSKHLIFAFKNEIDVQNRIHFVFFPFFDKAQITTLNLLLRAINENSEVLGKGNITLPGGRSAVSTIGNWIIDYKSSSISPKQGSLSVITYLTKSENIKILNKDESELLKNILLLYDWMRFQLLPQDVLLEIPESIPPRRPVILPSVSKPPAPVLKPSPVFSKPGTSATVPGRPAVPPIPHAPRPLSATRPQSRPSFSPRSTRVEAGMGEARLGFIGAAQPMHGLSLEQLKKEVAPLDYKEIEREVDMPELVAHKEVKLPVASVLDDRTKVTPSEIKVIDDLKKLDVSYLRRGELRKKISDIRYQITSLAALNRMYPYQVVMAFEQSPLFKLYLSHGSSRVVGQPSKDDLSQAEFEAMADLRKEIERL